jgi:hypothetical protein
MISILRRRFLQLAILMAPIAFLSHANPAAAQTNSSSAPSSTAQPATNAIFVYDVEHEVSVQGTVIKVSDLQASDSLSGEYLILSTEQGTVNIHLGPGAILSKNHVTLATGAKVSVAGAYVTGASGQVLLARLLRTSDQMVVLRSSHGLPVRPRAATNGSSITISSPMGGAR